MPKLYELSQQYQELSALADIEEMQEAVADTLEGLEGEFNDKAQALSAVVLNMDSDVEAIDSAIKRLQERKTAIKTRQQSMKDYLRDNMERCEIKSISCPLFTITCAKGREVAVIDSEEKLPEEFLSVETKIKPNKNEIAKALKEGAPIPGARLERTKSSIRIK